MKKITFLLLACSIFAIELSAQMHKCGVDAEMGAQIREQIIHNRNEMRDFVSTRNAVVYLPVRFFLVAESNGDNRTSEESALAALCFLNTNYADQEIQFFLKEFKYVNNTAIYDNSQTSAGFQALKNQMLGKYNAINVFLTKDAGEEGTAAYYQPPADGPNRNDWILSGETEADNFEVLTHEVGHYFSLNHPFYGWEQSGGGWNLDDHGNPVGWLAPDGSSNELADGSNCIDAGDMICDTPADYMFPFVGPGGCLYNLNVKDPLGNLISPDLTNFMNYGSCDDEDYHFTPMQKEEVQNSLNSSSRNYLPKNITPNLAQVESLPTLLSPQHLEKIDTYNSVTLEWTAVPNAESYFLEVINTGGGNHRYIVSETQVTLTNLEPSSNYFWSVIGYNEYSTCQMDPISRIVRTGTDTVTDTNEIPQLKDWSIQPNPVKSGEIFNLVIESSNQLKLDITVSTITGQTVQFHNQQQFANGVSFYEIDTNGLPAGVYLVSIRTGSDVETKRVSII